MLSTITTRFFQTVVKNCVNLSENKIFFENVHKILQYSKYNIYSENLCDKVCTKYLNGDFNQRKEWINGIVNTLNDDVNQTSNFFINLMKCKNGFKCLLDVRNNLPHLYVGQNRSMIEDIFVKIFQLTFSPYMLELEVVDKNASPDLQNQLIKIESVHAFKDKSDIFNRLTDKNKICFVLHHKLYAFEEPLVALYAVLTETIPSKINDILYNDLPETLTYNSAIFYSISSTQPGLKGINLGNYTIKSAVKWIQNRYKDNIETFCTLSPIPGFRSWLLKPTNQTILKSCGFDSIFFKAFNSSDFENIILHDNQCKRAESQTLFNICKYYLASVKDNVGYAKNSVANFHLQNGAEMYRLNWLANPNTKGMQESFGLMINYRYDLQNVETNALKYMENKEIAKNHNNFSVV